MPSHKLRIVYMGTPDFAVLPLKRIIEAGFQVVGVVTNPDKPAGRGQQLQESAVKKYAREIGLKILQPEKFRDPDFLQALAELKADLQLVVAFKMLPEVVWNMPPLGTVNLHASLLPDYRGAAPINRAVMNGETCSGVTTFLLKQEIDTGNIIFQEKVEIGEEMTAGELHDELMEKGADLLLKTVQAMEAGDYPLTDQCGLLRGRGGGSVRGLRDEAARAVGSLPQVTGGNGEQYFSQDAVSKLAPAAGIALSENLTPAEKLKEVQKLAEQGLPYALEIFKSIGVYLAHTLFLYARFYDIRNLIVLGRVASGVGGERIVSECQRVLKEEYPALAQKLRVMLPDENFRRVGQSMAAASLPEV